jgi:hypothetical protein
VTLAGAHNETTAVVAGVLRKMAGPAALLFGGSEGLAPTATLGTFRNAQPRLCMT